MVYIVRRMTQPVVLEAVCMSIFATMIFATVSFRHVITNASRIHSPLLLVGFFLAAFINTNMVVKVACVGIAVAGILFSYGMFKDFSWQSVWQSTRYCIHTCSKLLTKVLS
jgi:EamA domain-containing membrane protein RarD